MLHRVVPTFRPGIIPQFQLLEEIPGRAVLAFADLPAVVLSLLVGCPARIGAAERQARHAERQNVDASVALAGRRVARHRRAAGLVGIPWPAPWRGAGFQGGDDAVGDVLVVVARHAIGVAAAVHRLVGGVGVAHRSVLSSWVAGTPLKPRIPSDRGKGAQLARGHGRSLAAGGRRCGRPSHFIFAVQNSSCSFSLTPVRSLACA